MESMQGVMSSGSRQRDEISDRTSSWSGWSWSGWVELWLGGGIGDKKATAARFPGSGSSMPVVKQNCWRCFTWIKNPPQTELHAVQTAVTEVWQAISINP